MRLTRRALPLAALALAAGRRPDPPRPDPTLRVMWDEPPGDLHPYFAVTHTAFVIAHHVYDTLVVRDPETLRLRPALAQRWERTESSLTFALRPDAVFHDGRVLRATDVAATVRLATTDPRVAYPDNYAFLAGTEVLDSHTIRLHLAYPFPPALDFVAAVLPILPDAPAAPDAAADAPPAGTGPYRLAAASPGRIALALFQGYPADGPKAGAALEAISFVQMEDAAGRLAAVAAGDADWTWDFGAALFADAVQNTAIIALRQETMRVAFLAVDAAGRSGPGPWTDVRVRRAVHAGLDRDAIARAAAPLGARPLAVPCFPTQFGCDTAAVPGAAADPLAARKALAEAGFPDGFATDLVTALPERAVRPVVAALRALGIEARADILAPEAALARVAAGDAPLWLGLTDGFGINDVAAVLPRILGGGPLDSSDDDLLRQHIRAGSSGPADERRQAYTGALRLMAEDAALLPLYAFVRTYAFGRSLTFRASQDDLPRFYWAAWK